MVQYEVIAHSAPCQRSTLGKIKACTLALFAQPSRVAAFLVTLMKVPRPHVGLCDNVGRSSLALCVLLLRHYITSAH